MKKKILGVVAVIAIAAVATFNMNINNNDELSAISLANVEALAMNEGGGTTTIACYNGERGTTNYFGLKCGTSYCEGFQYFKSVSSTSRCTPRSS